MENFRKITATISKDSSISDCQSKYKLTRRLSPHTYLGINVDNNQVLFDLRLILFVIISGTFGSDYFCSPIKLLYFLRFFSQFYFLLCFKLIL